VQANLVYAQKLLQRASKYFQILNPELGGEELVESVAAELARLTVLIAENRQRQ
jgi:hypothetical protein